MTAPVLEIRDLSVDTIEGRPLFRELSLVLERERVAVVGRNGVGKTTLLDVIAGQLAVTRGTVVPRTSLAYVPQDPDPAVARACALELQRRAQVDASVARALAREASEARLASVETIGPGSSRGELRKLLLLHAKLSGAPLLLLDEPTDDLDRAGIAWLRRWLRSWEGGALVVSHHRPLLRDFEHFFVVAESGCRHVPGTFDQLQQQLADEHAQHERQYARNLATLAQHERDHERIGRRRARKKNVGRLHELRRCTSRSRLNEKRSYAQESQARATRIRDDRIEAVRGWAKATRRALAVSLPLELPRPSLPEPDGQPLATLEGVGVVVGGRPLWSDLDLLVHRQRLAVTGANGSGKTTLLRVLLGERCPTTGRADRRAERIGSIAQGASDWRLDEDLLTILRRTARDATLDALAARVVEHRFPLALAQRPLRSLSAGERVRAALICLFARVPEIELLVLDEPTYGLDFIGLAALERALRGWPGGLIVASHDHDFLENIGIETTLDLDGAADPPIDAR